MFSRLSQRLGRQMSQKSIKMSQKELVLAKRNIRWSPLKDPTNYKVVVPGNVTNQIAPDKFSKEVTLPPYAMSGVPPSMKEQEVNSFCIQVTK